MQLMTRDNLALKAQVFMCLSTAAARGQAVACYRHPGGFLEDGGNLHSQTHVRVCSGPHGGAKRGDVKILISRTLAWTDDPLDRPPTADDVTLLAAGQIFLIINVKTSYICCEVV